MAETVGKATFEELGIPFGLFEAPSGWASQFAGLKQCGLCRAKKVYCFVPDFVTEYCAGCGAYCCINAEAAHGLCGCGSIVDRNKPPQKLKACYQCVREGKAGFYKDTEFGIITYEDALSGLAFCQPVEQERARVFAVGSAGTELLEEERDPGWELRKAGLEIVRDEEGIKAVVAKELLLELLFTPNYSTWQGERWLFCCRQPMIYWGEVNAEWFAGNTPAGENRRDYFFRVVDDADENLMIGDVHDDYGIYLFVCSDCGRQRAHWDMA